jgi:hypothetical protein
VQPQWLAPRVRDVRNSPYFGRGGGFGTVDEAEGAGSAAGGFGSEFIMLTGGIESEDGNSRSGNTDATGGTTPRTRRASDASEASDCSTGAAGLSVAGETAAMALDALASGGVGCVRGSGGHVSADSAIFGAKSEPASAIVAVEIAVGVVASRAVITGTCDAGGADRAAGAVGAD